jgi:DNA-binding transcriptional LysR family regulator
MNIQANPARDLHGIPRTWTSLTIDQLQTFQLVAQMGSFSRAADNLFISPSAISQRINSLERIVGLPLFERGRGQAPHLTLAGEYLLGFCNRSADDLAQLSADIDALKGTDPSKALTIMIPPSLEQHLFPLLVRSFHREHPHVRIRMLPMLDCRQIHAALESGEADVGILPEAPTPESILAVPFMSDQLILVTSARHRLSVMGRASIRDLTGQPFVLPPIHTPTRQMTEAWARTMGIELDVVVETASLEAMKHAAINLDMFAVISKFTVASELNSQQLASVDMPGFPIEWRLCLVSKNRERMSPLARAFIWTLLHSKLSSLVTTADAAVPAV